MSAVSSDTRADWSTRLVHALVESGFATESDLAPLAAESEVTGRPLATILIERQVATPGVVVGALAQLAGLPAVDLLSAAPESHVLALLPEAVGREYDAVALKLDGNQLIVAFAEPPTPRIVDALSGVVGYRVVPMLADPTVIARMSSPGPLQVEADNAKADDDGERKSMPSMSVDNDMPLHIDDLLRYAVSVGASDLHLTADMPACIRLNGAIRPIEGCPKLRNESIREMVFGILPASQREKFESELELDTSHSIAGVGRFRANISMQRGTVAVAMRPIPHEIPTFDSLGIPESIRAFTELRRGLVLVTGPTGSGKSTTLAALVDIINRSKPLHIVTIEDPIEFLHTHKRSIIDQREIGEDTYSFSEALRRVLRQDPDVILVGELRDLETIHTALTAAETGHLVFATLHTQDAAQTVDRVIDVFPTSQQEQIRVMLAATLEGVVTQQLLVNAEGTGRAACCEVMVCTTGIRNLIRTAKTHQIYSLMQTGSTYGMQTMDQGLARLVRDGVISESVALDRSHNEDDLRSHLTR
ncbi:MAG TPA: PilT/PilU family type 4a pilus ATPase [Acidimicrobiales bacterium]|nr:PilT/PilU family type 4a pilus ATPase [Acidimicrobiales bacterium]